MNDRSPITVGIGVAYLVLGVVLLSQALGGYSVPWSVLGPSLLVGAGLVVLVAGLRRSRATRNPTDV